MTINGFVLHIPNPCTDKAFSCCSSKIQMNSSACLKWILFKRRYNICRFISQKLPCSLSFEIKGATTMCAERPIKDSYLSAMHRAIDYLSFLSAWMNICKMSFSFASQRHFRWHICTSSMNYSKQSYWMIRVATLSNSIILLRPTNILVNSAYYCSCGCESDIMILMKSVACKYFCKYFSLVFLLPSLF